MTQPLIQPCNEAEWLQLENDGVPPKESLGDFLYCLIAATLATAFLLVLILADTLRKDPPHDQ